LLRAVSGKRFHRLCLEQVHLRHQSSMTSVTAA
jgi:hypothetical protein